MSGPQSAGAVDRIRVLGVRGFGYHGVLEHEQALGQEFRADVVLDLDMSDAAYGDDLGATVDYGRVAQVAHRHLTGESRQLVETVADAIAREVAVWQRVRRVAVTIHKPHAPMPVGVADVSVTRTLEAPAWAVLGIGANLGDPVAALREAVEGLRVDDHTVALQVSPLYATDPVGGPEQPEFRNAVVRLRTWRDPAALLGLCQDLEAGARRERTVRWGPRTLDVDVLDYSGVRSSDPDLTLPHPRACERAFVLIPWNDLSPGDRPGGYVATVGDLLARLGTDDLAGVRPAPEAWASS